MGEGDCAFPGGLKSVRENTCRPYGTRVFVPLHPPLPCRAFISRRCAAGVLAVLASPLAFNGSSHAHTKARVICGLRRHEAGPTQNHLMKYGFGPVLRCVR